MTPTRAPRLDLNPSSADRWTTCTASPHFVLANAHRIPPSDTKYNQEGTTAHEVAASFLQNREPRTSDPYHCPVPVTKEMRWHAWNYMEYVEGLRKPHARMLVEQKLPLWYMEGRNAIVDAAVINDDSLHVIDYKYGEGIPVSPVRNLQTVIYAYSVGRMQGPRPTDFPVFSHIYQPRGRNAEDGASHVWETTWLEISQIAEEISCKANLVQGNLGGMPLTERHTAFAPSDKACQWCPAKGFCEARQQSLSDGFEIIDEQPRPLPSANVLSLEQVSRILKHKDDMVKFLNDVEQYAEDYMKAGNRIPGFKLVQSRGGNRFWSDPKRAAALLQEQTVLKREELVEEKVISPSAVEKLLGKGRFPADVMGLIAKPPGSAVIAPESDKRPEIGQNLLSEVEEI
jgi:hypothetical protein